MNQLWFRLSRPVRLRVTLSPWVTVRSGPGILRDVFVVPHPPARLIHKWIDTSAAAAGVENASGTLRTNAMPTIRTIVLRSFDKGDPIPGFAARWTVLSIKSIGTFFRIRHQKRTLSGICGPRVGIGRLVSDRVSVQKVTSAPRRVRCAGFEPAL